MDGISDISKDPKTIDDGMSALANPLSISLPEINPPVPDAINAMEKPIDISLILQLKFSVHFKMDAGNI